MAKVIMRVAGYDGQIALLPDRVVILREGLINALWYGFNSRREIPLGAISEIAFKPASSFKQGEIDFVRAGTTVIKQHANRVRFPKKKNQEFEMFKEKVFQQLTQFTRQDRNNA